MQRPTRLSPSPLRILHTARELRSLLQASAPGASQKTISWVANDFASLEEVSVENLRILRRIKRLSLPADTEKLWHLLIDLQVQWLSVASYDIESLRKLMPRLLKHFRLKKAKRVKMGRTKSNRRRSR
jgi:hypothetical protein